MQTIENTQTSDDNFRALCFITSLSYTVALSDKITKKNGSILSLLAYLFIFVGSSPCLITHKPTGRIFIGTRYAPFYRRFCFVSIIWLLLSLNNHRQLITLRLDAVWSIYLPRTAFLIVRSICIRISKLIQIIKRFHSKFF